MSSKGFDDDDISSGFIIDNYAADRTTEFQKVPCVGIRMVKDEVWVTSDLKVVKKFKKSAFGDLNFNDIAVIDNVMRTLRRGGVKTFEETFIAKSKRTKAVSSNKR